MKEGCRESVKEEGKTRNSGANVNTPKQGISSGLQLEAQITLSKNTHKERGGKGGKVYPTNWTSAGL